MRVAVVCPYAVDRPGGVQNQASHLVSWLSEAGHDAWLVAPGVGPPGSVYLGRSTGVPANRSVAPVALDPRAARRTVEAVRNADVVHIHEPLVPMVSLGAVIGATPPKVGTFHADPGRVAQAFYRLSRPLLSHLLTRLSVTTAVSEVAAVWPARLLGRVPLIIPNAIDVSAYRVATPRNPLRVAFLGRDEPRKGLDTLLAAWPGVRSRVPGAELIVMGTTRPAPPGVEFRGSVGEAEKQRVLAGCGVLVAPNLGGESFGLVLTEGMAAGCAVVASALPAFRAVVGDAGILVPPGDVTALSGALGRVLADPRLRDHLAAQALRRVASFDRTTVLEHYLAAYERAVG